MGDPISMLLIGGGLQTAGMAGQFAATKAAGKIERMEMETAAEMEELGATQREVDRKARLAEALASQIAGAGAAGIAAFEGSPLTILQADIEAEEKATERGKFMADLQADAFRTRGKMTEKMARQRARLGLLSDLGQTAFTVGRGLR